MQNMLATLDALWEKASLYMNLPKITITDVVEIIIIAFLLYYMLVWIKNTRAWNLLKGLMIVLLFVLERKEYGECAGDCAGSHLSAGNA